MDEHTCADCKYYTKNVLPVVINYKPYDGQCHREGRIAINAELKACRRFRRKE